MASGNILGYDPASNVVPQLAGMTSIPPEVITKMRDLVGDSDTAFTVDTSHNVGLSTLTAVLSAIQPERAVKKIQAGTENIDTWHRGAVPIKHVQRISQKITTSRRWILRFPERMADLTAPPRITEAAVTRVGEYHGAYLGCQFHVPRVVFMPDGNEYFETALETVSSGIGLEYKTEVLAAIRAVPFRRVQDARVHGQYSNPKAVSAAASVYQFGVIHRESDGLKKLTSSVIKQRRISNRGLGAAANPKPSFAVVPFDLKEQFADGDPGKKENFRNGMEAEGLKNVGPDYINNVYGIPLYYEEPMEAEGRSDGVERDFMNTRMCVGQAWYSSAKKPLELFVKRTGRNHSSNNDGGISSVGGVIKGIGATSGDAAYGSMTDARAIRFLNPNVGNLNWDIVTLATLIENCVAFDQTNSTYLPLRKDSYNNLARNHQSILEAMGANVGTTADDDLFVDPFIYFQTGTKQAAVAETWGMVDREAISDSFYKNWGKHTSVRAEEIIGTANKRAINAMQRAANASSFSAYNMGGAFTQGTNNTHVVEAFCYAMALTQGNNNLAAGSGGAQAAGMEGIPRNMYGSPNLPPIMPPHDRVRRLAGSSAFYAQLEQLRVVGIPERAILVQYGGDVCAVIAAIGGVQDFTNANHNVNYALVKNVGGALVMSSSGDNTASTFAPAPAAVVATQACICIPEQCVPPVLNHIASLNYIAESNKNGGDEVFRTWTEWPNFKTYANTCEAGVQAVEETFGEFKAIFGTSATDSMSEEFQNIFMREDMVPSYMRVDSKSMGHEMARNLNQMYAFYSNTCERTYKYPLFMTMHNFDLTNAVVGAGAAAAPAVFAAGGEPGFGQLSAPQLRNFVLGLGFPQTVTQAEAVAIAGGFDDVLSHPENYDPQFVQDLHNGSSQLSSMWSNAVRQRLFTASQLGNNTLPTLRAWLQNRTNVAFGGGGVAPNFWTGVKNILTNLWSALTTSGPKQPITDGTVNVWLTQTPRVNNRGFQQQQRRATAVGAAARPPARKSMISYFSTGGTVSAEYFDRRPVSYDPAVNINGFILQQPLRPSDTAAYGFQALVPRVLSLNNLNPTDTERQVENLRLYTTGQKGIANNINHLTRVSQKRSNTSPQQVPTSGSATRGGNGRNPRMRNPQPAPYRSAAYPTNARTAVPISQAGASVPLGSGSIGGGAGYGLMNPSIIGMALDSKHFVYRYKIADATADWFERMILLLLIGMKIYGRKLIELAELDMVVPLSLCMAAPWIEFEMWAVMYLNWNIGKAEYSMIRTNAAYDPQIEYMTIDVRFYIGAFIDNIDDVFVADCSAFKEYLRGWDPSFITQFAVTGTNTSRNHVHFNLEDFDARVGSMISLYYPASGDEPQQQVFCLSGKAQDGYMSQFYSAANGNSLHDEKNRVTYACAPYFCMISGMHEVDQTYGEELGTFEDQLEFRINVVVGRGSQLNWDGSTMNSGFGPLADLHPGCMPILNGGVGVINPATAIIVGTRQMP